MKRYGIAIVVIGGLLAEVVLGAAGPLDFGNLRVAFVKRLNNSVELPSGLFQSTPAGGEDHANKFFTTRTIAKLGPNNLSEYERKRVRNEICASDRMYRTNIANANAGPGSMGVYLVGGDVISVYDTVLTGQRLDAALRQLQNETNLVKAARADYYAVAMAKALELIHAGDVAWSNIDLNNFVIPPSGIGLFPVDFSNAKSAVGAANPLKGEEWKELVTVFKKMFDTIYKNNPREGDREFAAFINQPLWANFAWDQAAVTTRLAARLPNANPNTGNFLLNGMNNTWNNAQAYLNDAENIPTIPVTNLPALDPMLKAEHETLAANMNGIVVLDPSVEALIFGVAPLPGAPGAALLDNTVNLANSLLPANANFCTGWTGNE